MVNFPPDFLEARNLFLIEYFKKVLILYYFYRKYKMLFFFFSHFSIWINFLIQNVTSNTNFITLRQFKYFYKIKNVSYKIMKPTNHICSHIYL